MGATQIKKVFGEVIRRRRTAAGLTQEELAQRAGMTATYVSLVENGHKAPTIVTLHQLAQGLGTTMTSLISSLEKGLSG